MHNWHADRQAALKSIMGMQFGHAAWICSMAFRIDMQMDKQRGRGQASWACIMYIQHVHAAWTCGSGHAAWTCGRGYAAWTSTMNMQHGQGASACNMETWTFSINMQHRHSIDVQHEDMEMQHWKNMQYGHRHVGWTQAFSMDLYIQLGHGHGHAAWTWTCNIDMSV
jgi:hypothetical protein